jgi:hypothetical protein
MLSNVAPYPSLEELLKIDLSRLGIIPRSTSAGIYFAVTYGFLLPPCLGDISRNPRRHSIE